MGGTRIAVVIGLVVISHAQLASAQTLADGYSDVPAIMGLDHPVALRLSPDGSVFVAEKAGLVKKFGPLPSPGTGRVVIDLRADVDSDNERGLLAIALDPAFPLAPYVYVLYTRDAPPGQPSPVWNDTCGGPGQPSPTAPGGGCVASGRLVRYALSGDQVIGQTVLVDGAWYQQYGSHSVGDLAFGPDGMLYASAGDGASWLDANDAGDADQISTRDPDPGDPLGEGGALRAQDLLTSGDPVGLSGTVARIDPAGVGAPRIVAFGLRNPFRMTFRPGTRELWIGDVGASRVEEVDRIVDVADDVLENFGWPCLEGFTQGALSTRPICDQLLHHTLPPGTPGVLRSPHYFYSHGDAPGANELVDPCYAAEANALTAIAFHRGSLVIADYVVGCVYALPPDAAGLPDQTRLSIVARGMPGIVDIQAMPDGDLALVKLAGTIDRLHYEHRREPTAAPSAAVMASDPTTGSDPASGGGCETGDDPALAIALLLPWLARWGRRTDKTSHLGQLTSAITRSGVCY